jgi:hypothetical protein
MLDQRRVTGRRIVAFVIDTAVGYAIFWGMVVALGTEIDHQSGLTMTFEFGNGRGLRRAHGHRVLPGQRRLRHSHRHRDGLLDRIVTVSSRNRQRVGDLVAKTWVVNVEALGQPIATTPPHTRPAPAPVQEMPPPNWP